VLEVVFAGALCYTGLTGEAHGRLSYSPPSRRHQGHFKINLANMSQTIVCGLCGVGWGLLPIFLKVQETLVKKTIRTMCPIPFAMGLYMEHYKLIMEHTRISHLVCTARHFFSKPHATQLTVP
jgi:hypothetical protein